MVLFGHRRMGKTSILRNVTNLIPGIKFIYVNLQCLVTISDLGEMLMGIAEDIATSLEIEDLEYNQFRDAPELAFKGFLKKVLEMIEDERLIIALDEFETIEELIRDEKIPEGFMKFLRGLMHMSPRIAFAFAGLHTLQEMTADYFKPFFASVIPIHVGFLNKAATCQILENLPL